LAVDWPLIRLSLPFICARCRPMIEHAEYALKDAPATPAIDSEDREVGSRR